MLFFKVVIMKLGLLKRWQRWAIFSLLGVGLLWCVSWLVMPPWVQWQIEKQGSQALGRSVKLTQVDFRPWSMALLVRGLHIGKAGVSEPMLEPQLTIDEIEVNLSLQSLIYWAPVADAIWVRNPQLHLTYRGQGQFDIDDVLKQWIDTQDQTSGIPRMSLFNIRIEGGGVQFHDSPKSVTHALTELQLGVPFLSNIGSRREVATHPRLAFKLNGAVFDTDAETRPFAKDRHTQARFQVKGLDAAAYLPYWPAALPVQLADGELDMDLTLDFKQQAAPEVVVAGQLAVKRLKLQEKTNAESALPLLQWEAMQLKIDTWRPLEASVKLDSLSLDKPVLHLRRDASGAFNWVGLQEFFMPSEERGPSLVNAHAQYGAKTVQIAGGELRWQDDMTRLPVNLALKELDFQSSNLNWPPLQAEPALLSGKAKLDGVPVSWQGSTDLKSAQIHIKGQDLLLQSAAGYWAERFQPALSGKLSAELALDWRAAQGIESPHLLIKAPSVRVTAMAVGLPGQPEAAMAELAVEQLEVDIFRQRVRTGRMGIHRPDLKLSRSATGRWMFEDWLIPAQLGNTEAVAKTDAWELALGPLQITRGGLSLDDRFVPGSVKLEVREVHLSTGPWQHSGKTPAWSNFKLDLQTAQSGRAMGRLGFDGAIQWPSLASVPQHGGPLRLKGQLQIESFPVHPLASYGADWFNFDLKRADVGYLGALDMAWPKAGMDMTLKGHLSLDNLQTLTRPSGATLLDIKSLNLKGLDLGFKSGELAHLKVSETALNDFYAHLDIDSTGHLNWQNLLKLPPAKTAASQPLLESGPLGLVNGRILFSDHYIRPNYSAKLSDVAGSLGAFSNQNRDAKTASLAELSLRGRVEGSASLEVNGRIHPLTQPVALNVAGKVRDLELPELSPYSQKYAGYGIERGKLSADVNYRIDERAQLNASQKIVLNQLRFGDRSTLPDAPNLPVKLAVALLADRNGVININLPVSGSLQDPDFKVGAIVWKLVVGLIGKAVFSPLSLIAGAFASEERLEQIDFKSGSALLDANHRKKLARVAQLLIDKPGVNLTVVGEANPDTEREALRRMKLLDWVNAEKKPGTAQDGPDESGGKAQTVPRAESGIPVQAEAEAEDYLALLKSAYRRSSVPKPRNVLGLIKDLPQADMEALLLASISVDESDMRDLAASRAQKVRDALAALGVPPGQLFLGASVLALADRQAPLAPRVNLIVSTD